MVYDPWISTATTYTVRFADYTNNAGCLTSLTGYSVEYVSTDHSGTVTANILTTQRFTASMNSVTKDVDITIPHPSLISSLCTPEYGGFDLMHSTNYYRETYKIKFYPATPVDAVSSREILVPIKLVGNSANGCGSTYITQPTSTLEGCSNNTCIHWIDGTAPYVILPGGFVVNNVPNPCSIASMNMEEYRDSDSSFVTGAAVTYSTVATGLRIEFPNDSTAKTNTFRLHIKTNKCPVLWPGGN